MRTLWHFEIESRHADELSRKPAKEPPNKSLRKEYKDPNVAPPKSGKEGYCVPPSTDETVKPGSSHPHDIGIVCLMRIIPLHFRWSIHDAPDVSKDDNADC